jgi:glyoxylase I family protein
MPIGTTNRLIPGCGAHHIALQARDWEASLRLYRDVLGMQIVAEFGTPERRIVLLDLGDGSHLELFAPQPTTADQPASANVFTHIALATTNTRQATELVRQAGYPITVEPKDVQLGPIAATIAFFTGPNGETIEFFQTN